jgi:hypothetical protein
MKKLADAHGFLSRCCPIEQLPIMALAIIPAGGRQVIGQKYGMWIISPVNGMYNSSFAGAGPDVQISACPLVG